jgi:hypothetical protein
VTYVSHLLHQNWGGLGTDAPSERCAKSSWSSCILSGQDQLQERVILRTGHTSSNSECEIGDLGGMSTLNVTRSLGICVTNGQPCPRKTGQGLAVVEICILNKEKLSGREKDPVLRGHSLTCLPQISEHHH